MYYYDLDTCRLLDDHRQPAGGVACVRGSRCTMDVQLVGTGLSSYVSTIDLAAKPEGNYTGVPVARTSVNVPATGKVSIIMPTLTVPMDTLLGVGTAAEKPYITLTIQLTVIIGGISYISHNIRWVLHNSVNRPGLIPDGIQYPPVDQLVTLVDLDKQVAAAMDGGDFAVKSLSVGDPGGGIKFRKGPTDGEFFIDDISQSSRSTQVAVAPLMDFSNIILCADAPTEEAEEGWVTNVRTVRKLIAEGGGGGGGGYDTVIYPGYEIYANNYGPDYCVTAFFKGLDLTPGIWEIRLNGRLVDNVGGNKYPWYLHFADIAAISKVSGTTGATYGDISVLRCTQISDAYNSVWRPVCMGMDVSLRAIRDGYWATYEPWAHPATGAEFDDSLHMRAVKLVQGNDDSISPGLNIERISSLYITSTPGTVGWDWAGIEISLSMTVYLPQYLLATIGDKFRWSPFRGANGVTGYVAATAKRVGDTL